MRCDASRSIVHGVASIAMLTMLVASAAAQSQQLSNIDLCNGKDRTSAEPQINGCTALMQSDAALSFKILQVLAAEVRSARLALF